MSETLDYFLPGQAEEEASQPPAPEDSTTAADVAVPAEAPPAQEATTPADTDSFPAAPGVADQVVPDVEQLLERAVPTPSPSQPTPSPPPPAPPVADAPEAPRDAGTSVAARSTGAPDLSSLRIPAELPAVIPPEGLPWTPELSDALLPALSPRQYLVYHAVFMATYARGLPACDMRRRDLQIATGLSEASVRRTLAELSGPLGLLVIREKPRFVYEIRPLVPVQALGRWYRSGPPSS